MVYTASTVFLKALARAGITHVFVNWGSDHPAMLEDLERQRQESSNGKTTPEIVICPNEMVALSAAQGYAQITKRPAAVIVHVDVGTQALAGAIHNVARAQVPVLIYAGASPFSIDAKLRGGRNEWIMWMQDAPDQSAIVRQYMRHTAEIYSYTTMAQTIQRALQIAQSQPHGPVYLWARREVMEEEIPLHIPISSLLVSPSHYPPVSPAALTPDAKYKIASAMLSSQSPLIITSHVGRNASAVVSLLRLSTLLAIPIFCTCPSTVNIPFSHPFYIGLSYLQPGAHTDLLATSDLILVIDSDLPWIPANGQKPNPSARVFIIDSGNPLKLDIGTWHVDAELVCFADAGEALEQIIESIIRIDADSTKNTAAASIVSAASGGGARSGTPENSAPVGIRKSPLILDRAKELKERHNEWVWNLEKLESDYRGSSAARRMSIHRKTSQTLSRSLSQTGRSNSVSRTSSRRSSPTAPTFVPSSLGLSSSMSSLPPLQPSTPPAPNLPARVRSTITVSNIISTLRRSIQSLTQSHGDEVLILNEAISNYPAVWAHMRPEIAGTLISSGGSSLGWALGAAVGAGLGGEVAGSEPLPNEIPYGPATEAEIDERHLYDQEEGQSMGGYEMIVAIVGDGSFFFGVPSSAYWMARRYNVPFLTIVLNNGGWKSPKLSMMAIHPSGMGSRAAGNRLGVGFGFTKQPNRAQTIQEGISSLSSSVISENGKDDISSTVTPTATNPGGVANGASTNGTDLELYPDYAKIADGAAGGNGWVWGRKVGVGEPGSNTTSSTRSSSFDGIAFPHPLNPLASTYPMPAMGTLNAGGGKEALENAMAEAVRVVLEEKRCAVVDCILDAI